MAVTRRNYFTSIFFDRAADLGVLPRCLLVLKQRSAAYRFAELPTRERMRPRIEMMPTIPFVSTTTMCWKPPLVIASAAWLSDQSGAEKVLRGARWSATRSVSGFCPAAIEWRTSRALILSHRGRAMLLP